MNIKKILFPVFAITIVANTFAQISFQTHLISQSANGANSVYASDIDGDGDMDVLSASREDSKVAWYENMSGLGDFGDEQVISTTVTEAYQVSANDLDGDGDMDVISLSWEDDKITWYENLDGQGDFGNEQIISTNADGSIPFYVSDLDSDGDMDILTISADSEYNIVWYENMDGQGTFGDGQIIPVDALVAFFVSAGDLDGDGDMDIIASLYDWDKIVWYENIDGAGNFGEEQIISTTPNGAFSLYAQDIDGDDDLDLLSHSGLISEIAWYENTDGLGSFGEKQAITAEGVVSLHASDIDNDNDLDLLCAISINTSSGSDHRITWFNNTDGDGTFEEEQNITTDMNFLRSVYAADIDGDNDMDVLSASYGDDKIAWYENLLITSTSQLTLSDFHIYPIPTEGFIMVESETDIVGIQIYNSLGQLLLSNSNQSQIDLSALAPGLYLGLVKDSRGYSGTRKIMRK